MKKNLFILFLLVFPTNSLNDNYHRITFRVNMKELQEKVDEIKSEIERSLDILDEKIKFEVPMVSLLFSYLFQVFLCVYLLLLFFSIT